MSIQRKLRPSLRGDSKLKWTASPDFLLNLYSRKNNIEIRKDSSEYLNQQYEHSTEIEAEFTRGLEIVEDC